MDTIPGTLFPEEGMHIISVMYAVVLNKGSIERGDSVHTSIPNIV